MICNTLLVNSDTITKIVEFKIDIFHQLTSSKRQKVIFKVANAEIKCKVVEHKTSTSFQKRLINDPCLIHHLPSDKLLHQCTTG